MKIPTWFDQHELYTSSSDSTSAALHHEVKNKTRRRTATSTVRFAEENVVHEILPLVDYTPEELRSCWFNRVEYNSFKRSSLITLNLNREGKLAYDDPDRSMRGLECRTREITDSRRELRDSAIAAVLNEQRAQNGHSKDPQAIADLYHSVSWKSQYTAYTQGLADEQDALEEKEETFFFAPPERNTVLSKIISIDLSSSSGEPETTTTTTTIAGFDSDLWTSNATFSLFSLGIAVGAA
jgi:hypothetical protein